MKIGLEVINKDGLSETVDFEVKYLVLGGYSGRNTEGVMKHIEELAKLGVPKPPRVPMLYPISRYLLRFDEEVEVLDDKTNGEVEYVLFVDKDILYVTVGSDHTDRDLEKYGVRKSKQMYPVIIPKKVWKYKDVKDHWDEIVIKSFITVKGKEILYQEDPLKALHPPEKLIEDIEKELKIDKNGLVIFSGTIPSITGELLFGEEFKILMHDPVLKRSLEHKYNIKILPEIPEKSEGE